LNDDLRKVATLSPIAVEHTGKAALWMKHPVLLAPLDRNHERTLIDLALQQPSLDSEGLRTIGFAEVLSRLGKVIGEAPIPRDRRTRLVNCRNGAMHVGASRPEVARGVLVDSLSLLNWLLADMERAAVEFFGTSHAAVLDLLEERRSEIERTVADRLHRALDQYSNLRTSIPEQTVLLGAIEALAEANLDHYKATELPGYVIEHACPGCTHRAASVGSIEIDYDGEGEYSDGEVIYSAWPVAVFTPQLLHCGVCRLRLLNQEELAAAHLTTEPSTLDVDDLDFDLQEYASYLQDRHDYDSPY